MCEYCRDFQKDGMKEDYDAFDIIEKKITFKTNLKGNITAETRYYNYINEKGELVGFIGGDGVELFLGNRKINYCPMCGRKLTDE